MRLAVPQCTDTPLSIVWEECACLLCGNANHTPLLEAADPLGAGMRFLVVKCNRCGLCFTNPRPDLVSIEPFYPINYPCHLDKEFSNKARFWKADPMRTLLPIQGLARLLDFGCGTGNFLRRMHALGWNVTGLDPAEAVVARIREQQGLPAYAGTLPHPLWSEPCFEAITMWQSLEHVHQPLATLNAAYRLLTPGGKLLVAVPNFDSLASRWFGAHWIGLDVPRHLTHFTPRTLRLMLGQAGFEGIEIRQQQHRSWIRHSAERAGGGFLTTRLGAGLAGWWGSLTGRAESILAIATK